MPVTPRVESDRSLRNRAIFTLEAQRLLAAGRAGEVVEICKRGLIHHPANHTGYLLLARAYHMLGETDRALNVIIDGYRRTGSQRLRKLHAMLTDTTPATAPPRVEPDATPATAPPHIEQDDAPVPVASENESSAIAPVAEITAEPVDHQPSEPEPASLAEPDAVSTMPVIPAAELPEQVELAPTNAEPVPVEAEQSENELVDIPVAEIVAVEIPVIETPVAETIVVEIPATETPIADIEIPVAEAPVAEIVVMETPVAEAPIVEIAVVETPIAEGPISEIPVAEAPIAEITVAEIPVAETPATENPIVEIAPAAETAMPALATDTMLDTELPAEPAEEWLWTPDESFFVAVESDREDMPVHDDEPSPAAVAVVAENLEPELDQSPPTPHVEEAEQPVTDPLTEPEPPSPSAIFERLTAADGGLTMVGARTAPATAQPGARAEPPDRARPLPLSLHAGKSISRLRSSNLRLIPGLEFAPLRHEDHLRRQSIAPLISEPMPQPEVRSRNARKGIEESTLPPLPGLGAGTDTAAMPPEMRITATMPPNRSQAPVAEPEPEETNQPRAGQSAPAPFRIFPTGALRSEPGVPEKRAPLTPLEELARRLENARIPVVEEPEPRSTFEPSIVSDTLANILVAQGAYAEALKAFQTLARVKPERFEYYQGRIQEMKWRLRNPGGTWPPADTEPGE